MPAKSVLKWLHFISRVLREGEQHLNQIKVELVMYKQSHIFIENAKKSVNL